jgi:hypothetical protein
MTVVNAASQTPSQPSSLKLSRYRDLAMPDPVVAVTRAHASKEWCGRRKNRIDLQLGSQ